MKSVVCTQGGKTVLNPLSMKHEGLEKLDLRLDERVYDKLELFFSKHGKSLKTLRLIFSEPGSGKYYQKDRLPKSFSLCENLEELSLSTKYTNQELWTQDFKTIASFQNLKVLKLDTRFRTTYHLEVLIKEIKCSNLEKLEVHADKNSYWWNEKPKSLKDTSMEILLKKCPKLRSIKLSVRDDLWDLSNKYLFELCKSRNIFVCFDHIKLCDDICAKGHDEDLPKRQYSMMKYFHEQDPRTLKKYIEMENVYLRYNVKNWWNHY